MARERRVIGYGICGPGEAGRFMQETLEEFKRLCDETIILLNGSTMNDVLAERELVESYGFKWKFDQNEWGKLQWAIKQKFVENHVSKLAQEGDVMVCLDMDERFDRHMNKEWLMQMPFDAYKVFIVDLWNDPEHYKPESCFWNTRIWRWTGNTEWIRKPVHCGLAPRWAVAYNRHAPFLLIHKGLMLRSTRDRKIERYEKYDPQARHLGKPYYAMLHSDTAEAFDEEALHATIDKEVASYNQTKPRQLPLMATPKGRFAYVRRDADGATLDIPEKQLQETLKRGGFTFMGWADEAEAEMEEMFADDEEEIEDDGLSTTQTGGGSYQRPLSDEAAEFAALNARDDAALTGAVPAAGEVVVGDGITQRNRLGMKERETIRQAAKGTVKKAVKKAAKKTAAKKKTVSKKVAAKKTTK